MNTNKKISFVIPCYFSEKSLAGVVETIISEFSQNNIEIILVNDGSTDETFDVIKKLAGKYNFIKGINLSKNFGQDGARMAGYNYCTGDYIVSLDDDGQNPPGEAHKLIAKLEEGYEVVFGQYHVKKDTKFKTFGSKVNDLMANTVIGKPKNIKLCSYFVMTKFVRDEIIKYKGAFPYVWGLILRTTRNIANIYIEHKYRGIGKSTYTLKKLLALWLNGFTAFSVIPLRMTSILGLIFSGTGFIAAFYVVISTLIYGKDVSGWASLMSLLLVVGGILMLMLGLLGEYVGRIYISINNAPQYVVHEIIDGKN